MQFNDYILLLTAILSAAMVLIASKTDKERLYSLIIIFLFLISIVGGKVVEFFGHQTNTGNIFYASVFLATYFLVERYGTREGVRSIFVGVTAVVFFSVLLQLTLMLISSPGSVAFNNALAAAFAPAPRLALASLVAYMLSQTLNVYLYAALKKYFEERQLWLRANISNVLSQLLDSAVFFSIAFFGVVPTENVADILLTGFVIKVAFMLIASPLLYLNRAPNTGAI